MKFEAALDLDPRLAHFCSCRRKEWRQRVILADQVHHELGEDALDCLIVARLHSRPGQRALGGVCILAQTVICAKSVGK